MYAGLADPSRFPRREWLAAARRAVDSATMAELGYPDPRGAERLRGELAAYLSRTRGVQADSGRPHPPAIVLGYGASPAARARADIGLAVEAIEAGTDAPALRT
jgi:aspartate/methionine/tyrosine aminotransferase